MFDEMPCEEGVVVEAGGEEVGEELGEEGRGVDGGGEGNEDWILVVRVFVGFFGGRPNGGGGIVFVELGIEKLADCERGRAGNLVGFYSHLSISLSQSLSLLSFSILYRCKNSVNPFSLFIFKILAPKREIF